MAYRNISIGDNTREASDLDATADLSLMNNTTAGTLSIASNGKLYLGGNPNQRAVQLVLTGNNTGVAADLASGASLDLTVSTETVSRSADSGWAAIQAENGSIRISGTEPSINVNIYGLGAAGRLGHPAGIHHQRPLCGKRTGHGGRDKLDGGHGEPDLCRLRQPRL